MHPALPLLLAATSAAVTLAMTRLGTLDHPGARSSHARSTPKGGGVGILAAFLLGTAVLLPHWREQAPLILATVFIAGVAWADDLRSFSFTIKLAAQCLAASVVARSPALAGASPLPEAFAWAWPWLALAWVLLVTNAVNFIDGLNGLAAGCTAIISLLVFGVGLARHDAVAVAVAFSLAAGIAGFLPFNFPEARIFMGDVGSQPCGFLLAVLGLRLATSGSLFGRLLVPAALCPIVLDVLFTLARRAWAGARLTDAHRGHLYQVAHRAGWPAGRVTLTYWALTLWSGGSALLLAQHPFVLLPALLAPFAVWGVAVRGLARRARLGAW